MPKTPHSSLNLSMLSPSQPSRVTPRWPSSQPRERRRPARLGLGHRTVDRRRRRRPRSRIASPPVRPMRAAGTPAAARRRQHRAAFARVDADDDARRRLAEERRRQSDRRRRRTARRRNRRRPRRCRRCRSSTPPASPRSRLRRNRAPIESAPSPPDRRSSRCSARSRARSSAGGTPRSEPVDRLQILAAAELAEVVAEQDDRRARPRKHARPHARRRRRCTPTTPMTGVGRIALAVGLVVEADVAAGDRNVERAARLADARRRPRRTAT